MFNRRIDSVSISTMANDHERQLYHVSEKSSIKQRWIAKMFWITKNNWVAKHSVPWSQWKKCSKHYSQLYLRVLKIIYFHCWAHFLGLLASNVTFLSEYAALYDLGDALVLQVTSKFSIYIKRIQNKWASNPLAWAFLKEERYYDSRKFKKFKTTL